MDTLYIVIPAYNEEKNIEKVINDWYPIVEKYNAGGDSRLVIINDGSKDKTLSILRDLSKKDDRVRFISFSRNFGKEGGMYAGLENATGDYVAIMDADMQDPPSMIKTMYHDIKEEGYDCVALCSPQHVGYNFIRKFFTNCWYKLIAKI